MPSPINFVVQDTPNGFRERGHLRAWLSAVARREGYKIEELTYVLMKDEALLSYNQSYLQHDDLTDVITFDHGGTEHRILADILISYDRVKDNAKDMGVSVGNELRRVMVHGLLHLCGHADSSPARKKAMRSLEDKHLAHYGR
jgi:rRNA maturation RNase YbeY